MCAIRRNQNVAFDGVTALNRGDDASGLGRDVRNFCAHVIAVFRKRRTQSEINRFPRREFLRGELGLALASDGIEIAPDLAGRDREFERVVLAQKRCEMRLHDDSGSTDVHGAAFALEYLHVGANAPQGNAGAQSTD